MMPLLAWSVILLGVLTFALFVCGGYSMNREFRQARHLAAPAKDRDMQARFIDFATPLLPWSLRRSHIVTALLSGAAFAGTATLALLLSSSLEARFFAGWCLLCTVAGLVEAIRVSRSHQQTLPKDVD